MTEETLFVFALAMNIPKYVHDVFLEIVLYTTTEYVCKYPLPVTWFICKYRCILTQVVNQS